ncbi:MAG: hypothetical protein AABY32_01120 [Nanoarchaeota archaeon]
MFSYKIYAMDLFYPDGDRVCVRCGNGDMKHCIDEIDTWMKEHKNNNDFNIFDENGLALDSDEIYSLAS